MERTRTQQQTKTDTHLPTTLVGWAIRFSCCGVSLFLCHDGIRQRRCISGTKSIVEWKPSLFGAAGFGDMVCGILFLVFVVCSSSLLDELKEEQATTTRKRNNQPQKGKAMTTTTFFELSKGRTIAIPVRCAQHTWNGQEHSSKPRPILTYRHSARFLTLWLVPKKPVQRLYCARVLWKSTTQKSTPFVLVFYHCLFK
jgi:hypothetical protein